jgi:putative flavoprotein involved in K+ transport
MEGGTEIKVKTVIWCTGFRPDFSWIDIEIQDETGWPLTERGISKRQDGLYFMGMPFQFGLASGLIGGVGRDAAYLAKKLAN